MILITGGAGYIGSHTALEFLKNNFSVVIFDNLENGHIETVDFLKAQGNVNFEQGDLKNFEDINKVFDKYEIDAVIHFAGYIRIEESVQNPEKYYTNNVNGTLNLLNAMREHNVNKIVFSSSCATYGEPQYIPIDEKHPQNPVNPYGESKLIIEKKLADYDKNYNIKSIILRYFNVIGCEENSNIGEWHMPETHIIPNILRVSLVKDTEFKIFGNDYDTPDGTCIRDYVDVNDLANAHLLAYKYLNHENKSETFNLGSEKGISVKEIFETCEKVIGKKIPVKYVERRKGDTEKLCANSTKAKLLLGWKPAHSLEDSIKTAYEWEKKLR